MRKIPYDMDEVDYFVILLKHKGLTWLLSKLALAVRTHAKEASSTLEPSRKKTMLKLGEELAKQLEKVRDT